MMGQKRKLNKMTDQQLLYVLHGLSMACRMAVKDLVEYQERLDKVTSECKRRMLLNLNEPGRVIG